MRFTFIALCSLLCTAAFAQEPFGYDDLISLPTNSAAAGGSFTANTATFNGGSQYMVTSSALTSASDGGVFTISFWIKESADGTLQYILYNAGAKFSVARNTSNQLTISGTSPGGTPLLSMTSSQTLTVGSWNNVVVAVDLSDNTKRHVYFNGVEDSSATWPTYSPGSINFSYSGSPAWRVGAGDSGGNPLNGALCEFAFYRAYINDPTKFYSGGHPISLGSTGSLPGATPVFYFSLNGSGSSWATDSSGNGNTFTVNSGPLGSTTPP